MQSKVKVDDLKSQLRILKNMLSTTKSSSSKDAIERVKNIRERIFTVEKQIELAAS